VYAYCSLLLLLLVAITQKPGPLIRALYIVLVSIAAFVYAGAVVFSKGSTTLLHQPVVYIVANALLVAFVVGDAIALVCRVPRVFICRATSRALPTS
jgi:hypothetical protein